MKKIGRLLAVVGAVVALASCQNSLIDSGKSDQAAARAFSTSGYSLVWQDEFDGSNLNSAIWTAETGGGGWGNNELEYYRAENATVGGGLLSITAKRENYGGYAFTSARIKTQDKYTVTYGKVAARIKMPAGYGMWPAFWMLGNNISSVNWPVCGEIDIAEMAGGQGGEVGDRTTYGTLHWDSNGHAMYGKTYDLGAPLSNDFHVYEAEWDETYVIIRIDGIEYYRIDITPSGLYAFHKPFFLLFNLAIGGNFFNPAISDPNVVAATPQSMQVDWVRVYKKGDSGNGTTNPNPDSPAFMIVNKNSGKALDLIGGNTANASRINQWSFDYNGPNQRFQVLPTENGHFKILSMVSGQAACIADDSTATGAQLHTWPYIAGNTSHQWDLIDAGNGWFKIRNVRSGKMLDVDGFSTANDAKVQQWDDNGGQANQLWRLQAWGDYFIKAASGRYVCVANMGSANGARVIQYDFQNQAWFKWHFDSVGDGNYKLWSLNAPGRVLCVGDGSWAAAYWCHIWDYNTANVGDQKIRIQPLVNGKFKFYFVHDGMSWDIPGGQSGNNIPLQQYPGNGNSWQDFTLERVN